MQHSPADRMVRRRAHENIHREPALIDLPLDLPSIPILAPLLTELIQGKTTPSSTSAPPAVTPPPSPPPPPPPASSQPPQNQSPPPASTPPSDSPTTTNGGQGSNTTGNEGSGNSDPSNSPSNGSGGGDSGSGAESGFQPSATPGDSHFGSGGSDPVVNIGGVPDNGNLGDSNNSGNNSQNSDSNSGNSNSGLEGSSGSTYLGGSHSGSSSGSVPSHSPTGLPGSGSSNTGSGSNISGTGSGDGNVSNDGPATVSDTSKHGLGTGAIAGIVVALVVLLIGLIIFIVRRRYKSKRSQRRDKWMAYGNTPGSNSLPRSGFSSARSSFASPDVNQPMTHSLYNHENVSVSVSEGRAPTQMSDLALPPVAVVIEHTGGPSNRNSVYSIGSTNSSHSDDSNYVYLTPASANGIDAALPSPISVRPFTPSESWSFPKPPASSPNTPASTVKENPFSDEASTSGFSAVETIMRPFAPSMPDELAVTPGDFVRMLQSFDDGWALVEKFGTMGNTATGLIPIDCLRPAGEQLSSFISSKRLSSHGNMLGVPKFL